MSDRVPPKPSRESSTTQELSPRPIQEIAAESLNDIDRALERLRAYGSKVPRNSRLHQARAILQHAVQTRVLVPQHRGDTLGLRALELAFDYGAIAATLPDERIASVRAALEQSVSGPLDPLESTRGALQLQSQLLVRAAFVRGGVTPIHPTRSPRHGKSPDLVLENCLSQYGVEAKRPQLAHNILPRMRDAREQLAEYDLRGAILVDVTDCVRHLPNPEVDQKIREFAQSMYDEIFVTGEGYRPGNSGIMVAGAYARVAWTSAARELDSTLSVHSSSNIGLFAHQRNTLLDHRARWLRASFEIGLTLLNQTLSERG